MPLRGCDKKHLDHAFTLKAANGTTINTYGERCIFTDLGFKEALPWVFTVANVEHPIIGSDFLKHHDISIHLRKNQLTHNPSQTSILAQLTNSPSIAPISCHIDLFSDKIELLLQKFPDITKEPCASDPIKHNFVHRIITEGSPVSQRPRRLNPTLRDAADATLQKMLMDGTIRPSSSPWSSPIHLVPKKSEDWRLVGDYRLLNNKTKKDSYPLPYLSDFSANLHGLKVFSVCDLKNAFHQVPIAEEDIEKTALATPFGNFEFVRMSFGLCGAAQTFQRFIDSVLRDLTVETPNGRRKVIFFAYVDDILIASKSEEAHLEDLDAFFSRLQSYGLHINLKKCKFLSNELDFLGHRINSEGTSPLPGKVQTIRDYDRPTTIQGLRRYLGLLNFYHSYIQNAAQLLAPLTSMLSGARSKNSIVKLKWNSEADKSFHKAKEALSEATILHHPVPGAETSIAVDASDFAVGGVLQQRINNIWKPISFFSKKLSKAQQHYSTFGKELFAVFASLQHFRYFVEGTSFYILTDHQPLIRAILRKKTRDLPREERWLEYISIFTTDIRHIKGSRNVVADALSRQYTNQSATQEDTIQSNDIGTNISAILSNPIEDNLVSLQEQDPELKAILDGTVVCSGSLVKVGNIYCNVLNGQPRRYIPSSLRLKMFKDYHNLSHPGIRATKKYLTSRYFWPNMNKDITQWTRTCISCQKAKVVRHNSAATQSIPPASSKFSEIHLDLVGPLPINKNNRYILTIIDRFSRWPEAIPLPDIRAETVADAFIANWIARFGVPQKVTTDRGPQFESYLWKELMSRLGTIKIRTTSFHPEANGLIERFHRRLKDALRAHADIDPHHWVDKLPFVLLSARTALRDDGLHSPAQTVYGSNLTLPSDLISPETTSHYSTDTSNYTKNLMEFMNVMPSAITRPPKLHSQIDKNLFSTSHVFVRNNAKQGLQPNYLGPYKVLARTAKYFTVQLPRGPDTISVDRLKVAHLGENVLLPPRPTPFVIVSNNVPQPVSTQPADLPNKAYCTRAGRKTKPPSYLRYYETK